jgi:hypothetical protein
MPQSMDCFRVGSEPRSDRTDLIVIFRHQPDQMPARGSDRETAQRLFGGVPVRRGPGGQPTEFGASGDHLVVQLPLISARRVAANLR